MKHHSSNRSPAEILMYGHHRASGGSTTMGSMASMPSNEPHFKKGGSGHPKPYMRNGRSCHAEGDTVGMNPVNGYEYPESPENKRRGGSLHKRKHRADGGDMEGYAEGDSVYAEGDSVEAVPYRKGGRTHSRRRHHAEGGDAFNEGGDVYAEGGDTSDHLRRGGRARRHHAEGGDTYNEGGDVDREHHNFGDTVGSIASAVLPFLSFLKKGGSAHSRRRHHAEGEEVPIKRAMGGVGKLRKGMMS